MKIKLKTSTSFRALAISSVIYLESLKIDIKAPTHTTILNWIHKIGYYELYKLKEKADDWIIILDESIQFGQEKVLVILGIREKNIDFTRPLQFKDLLPLRIITKTNWNGTLLNEVLQDLKEEIGYIKYAVADYGSDIKKGLNLANIKHIHDLTHNIGLIIEKILSKEDDFFNLAMKIKKMRKQFAQTKIAFLKPPKLRTKCRYRNIMLLSNWGEKIIKYIKLHKDNNEVMKKLGWILENEEIINEYSIFSNSICEIEKILKWNGITKESKEKCNELLTKNNFPSGIILKSEMLKYFKQIEDLLPHENKVLISSDILESAFGKYKNYVSSNPMAGITNLILCISAFTSNLDENTIKNALEKTTINHIKKWTKEFVGDTLLKRRRMAFNNA